MVTEKAKYSRCAHCDKEFPATRAKYCSVACRNAAMRHRRAEQQREDRRWWAKASKGGLYAEQFFPVADLPGVELGTRIPPLRLVLRKGKEEAYIWCVHVAVTLPQDPGEVITTENRRIKLAPSEHFLALASYAQCLAEIGLYKLFALATASDPAGVDLPIGFNSYMQAQFLDAAKSIGITDLRYLAWEEYLRCEQSWLKPRLRLIDIACDFFEMLKDAPFIASLEPTLLPKIEWLRHEVGHLEDEDWLEYQREERRRHRE